MKRIPSFLRGVLLLGSIVGSPESAGAGDPIRFDDDFESGLEAWLVSDPEFVSIVDSGDPERGRVLRMGSARGYFTAAIRRVFARSPAEPVYALIRGSGRWGPFRLEGELYFPENEASYLGLIYHHRANEGRTDFGSAYVIVKDEDRYIRFNPHYDWNAGRALYEEFRIELSESDIGPHRWLSFAAEVVGRSFHFYVGDMTTPRLTLSLFRGEAGQVGLKPRIVGGPVWVDEIRVRSIERHSYQGPARPRAPSAPIEGSLTEWQTMGPLSAIQRNIEAGAKVDGWAPFETDPRGAIVTAELLGYESDRRIGYFRTRVAPEEESLLEFSSAVGLAIWIDGQAARMEGPGVGHFDFRRVAWFDFREGPTITVGLSPGPHEVIVRVESDYSGVGFFARTRPRR